MDFNPSEDQRMLANTMGKFVRDRYDLERRKSYLATPKSFSAENWEVLVDLGVTALVLPDELGGFDGSPADVVAVMEQLGKGLVVEPVSTSAIFAARLLAASAKHVRFAQATLEGHARIAVAFADPPASRDHSSRPMQY